LQISILLGPTWEIGKMLRLQVALFFIANLRIFNGTQTRKNKNISVYLNGLHIIYYITIIIIRKNMALTFFFFTNILIKNTNLWPEQRRAGQII